MYYRKPSLFNKLYTYHIYIYEKRNALSLLQTIQWKKQKKNDISLEEHHEMNRKEKNEIGMYTRVTVVHAFPFDSVVFLFDVFFFVDSFVFFSIHC